MGSAQHGAAEGRDHSRPLLIDTDPGVDDALALLLAFRSPEWRVAAVTTVAGNVPVALGTANVARILGVVSPDPAPVVGVGAEGPRTGSLRTATHVHGEDGLAGLAAPAGGGRSSFPEAPLRLHGADAGDLMVECARRWGPDLDVVMLGPLTNLAVALERDAAALRRVRQVVVMGGAIGVPGNVTPVAEFNVSVDPESAGVVLGAGLPLTLVPLDATRKVVWRAPGDPSGLESGDPAARFAGALGRAALDHAGRLGEPGVFMHDPLAVGVALDPTLVEVETLPVTVETQGVITRGMTVADRRSGRHHDPAWPRVRVALGVDAIRFLRMFEERVCPRSA